MQGRPVGGGLSLQMLGFWKIMSLMVFVQNTTSNHDTLIYAHYRIAFVTLDK